MYSNTESEPASSRSEQQLELLPRYDAPDDHNSYQDDDDEKTLKSPSILNTTSSRVECLDGLRGIACIAVFNYHFFWPWTQSVMLGHGFLGPLSPEPYSNWLSLPIISLLHRGRAMVSIFFAISGYVLCRHIVRSIHSHNLDAAYRSLSSSVFRRVFRLYVPATISMLIVAVLAQTGAFRSETSIYQGPDSTYINGSLIVAQPGSSCHKGAVFVTGVSDIAKALGLHSSAHLRETTSVPGTMCVNRTSVQINPVALYGLVQHLYEHSKVNVTEAKLRGDLHKATVLKPSNTHHLARAEAKKEDVPPGASAGTAASSLNPRQPTLQWVQYGGSWEEHPLRHDNISQAIQNFTRVYAEWANPFNFNHYHTRYDPHTYTMPIELRGSMVLYMFLLGTLSLRTTWRLVFQGALSIYSIFIGRWEMGTFLGGAMLSEMDIWNILPSLPAVADTRSGGQNLNSRSKKRGFVFVRWAAFALALYLLSYPDVGAEHTPGFMLLSWFVPRYYYPQSQWMFYQSIGAVLLIPCIIHSPILSKWLESRVAQYLGKISFSLYLVHGPVLHGLGFWIMPRLFERFGRIGGYILGWVGLFVITMYLSHWWYKKIDVWSASLGKRVEKLVARQM